MVLSVAWGIEVVNGKGDLKTGGVGDGTLLFPFMGCIKRETKKPEMKVVIYPINSKQIITIFDILFSPLELVFLIGCSISSITNKINSSTECIQVSSLMMYLVE